MRRAGRAAIPREELVGLAPQLDMGEIGQNYVARIAARCDGERVVDKTPLNFLYIGIIAAALPNSVIIHSRRHAMANAYGIYKVLFNQGYPFSYRLPEIAAYMGAERQLMSHWRELFGDRIVEVEYEAVLADQEGETRRLLLAAAGLDWDPACLAFHKNPAPSSTQSAVQVRAPISTTARDRWRDYTRELQPLREALMAQGFSAADLA